MPLQQVFQGMISGYQVKMILNSQGLVFFLWNDHRRRCYQARIPYLLEGKSLQIQNVFVNLDEFFVYFSQFSQDKDRISINEKGTIRVAHIVKKSKKMIPPVVYISTEVMVTGVQMKEQTKLHRQISDVRRQNLVLQNRITQLQELSEARSKEIEELKCMFNKKENRYSDSSQSQEEQEQVRGNRPPKRKKKYSVISGGRSSLVQLNTSIKELGQDLQVMRGKIEKQQPRPRRHERVNPALVSESAYKSDLQIFGQKMHITVDENNKFLSRQFKIEGNRIEKIRGFGRYQLLSKQTFPPIGRYYYSLFIEKVSYQIFSFGIVNQKRRNFQNSHEHPDLISYFAKTGGIWEYNEKFPCRSGGPKIPNGVEIRVSVDMNKYAVTFYMDGREIASTVIQSHLRGQRLVAYLQINYCGDVVYWNDRTTELQ